MFVTGRPAVQFDLIATGTILGFPDIWRNSFPVSETKVDLMTSDPQYNSPVFGKKPGPLATANTGRYGFFYLTSTNHPNYVPDNSLRLEFTNIATGEKIDPKRSFVINRFEWVLGDKHFDLGDIQVPWSMEVPVIATWLSRSYKYPADLARGLKAGITTNGLLELIRPINGSTPPDPTIDLLFSILESESKIADTGVVDRLVKELAATLGFLGQQNILKKTLERCDNVRFNTLNITDFKSEQLALAVARAFTGIPKPNFLGFEGRAAFCAVVFAAIAVQSGFRVSSIAGPIGDNQVVSVVVSQ